VLVLVLVLVLDSNASPRFGMSLVGSAAFDAVRWFVPAIPNFEHEDDLVATSPLWRTRVNRGARLACEAEARFVRR